VERLVPKTLTRLTPSARIVFTRERGWDNPFHHGKTVSFACALRALPVFVVPPPPPGSAEQPTRRSQRDTEKPRSENLQKVERLVPKTLTRLSPAPASYSRANVVGQPVPLSENDASAETAPSSTKSASSSSRPSCFRGFPSSPPRMLPFRTLRGASASYPPQSLCGEVAKPRLAFFGSPSIA
jgi:hypothetical protein